MTAPFALCLAMLVSNGALATELNVLFDGKTLADWDTARDPARISRELKMQELSLIAEPPALRWRFVPKTVSFNDIFLRRQIETA
ncbi:MAG: hypothetical protein H5T86_16610, partial [Armatimonadetes bacterium]|nr:hypothetical protein [Armatimonadota bacterium]